MNHQTANYVTGDPAFAVDHRGVIVLWNQAAEKTLGHPASAALGKPCWTLLQGRDEYENQYCGERCALREMAFGRRAVNGFPLHFKTAGNGFCRYSICCLIVHDQAGQDLLLHICRPANGEPHQATGNGNGNGNGNGPTGTNGNGHGNGNGNNGHAARRLSANGHRGALTERELEVLSLLAEGKPTGAIAKMMCISTSTVRNHIQHILYKLNVHSRLEAVVLGARLDLI